MQLLGLINPKELFPLFTLTSLNLKFYLFAYPYSFALIPTGNGIRYLELYFDRKRLQNDAYTIHDGFLILVPL